nr:putative nucleotidyltransferase, ribonuclease H [Tanacetum cinerariifolium]
MCIQFTDVAQVANAARNYKILHERDDDDVEQPDKRQKSGDRHQPTTQQSSHRNHGHNNDRHGSDRRGGSDNHCSSNNNYSGNNNRNSGNGRDQRNRGQQSNRSVNLDTQESVVELLVPASSVAKLAICRRIARRTPLRVHLVRLIRSQKLKEARTRQKSYADKHRRSIEFQPGDRVFLKIRADLSYVEEPEAILDRHEEQDYSFHQDSLEEPSRAGSYL